MSANLRRNKIVSLFLTYVKVNKTSDMVGIKESKAYMYDVVGAIYEVRKEMGVGLNESCYQEALEMQLQEIGVSYKREMAFNPYFHGKKMKASFRLDFLCKNNIIVECKAVSELNENHRAQLFNYMHLLKYRYGILVNFAPKYFEIERYLYDEDTDEILNMYGNPISADE